MVAGDFDPVLNFRTFRKLAEVRLPAVVGVVVGGAVVQKDPRLRIRTVHGEMHLDVRGGAQRLGIHDDDQVLRRREDAVAGGVLGPARPFKAGGETRCADQKQDTDVQILKRLFRADHNVCVSSTFSGCLVGTDFSFFPIMMFKPRA